MDGAKEVGHVNSMVENRESDARERVGNDTFGSHNIMVRMSVICGPEKNAGNVIRRCYNFEDGDSTSSRLQSRGKGQGKMAVFLLGAHQEGGLYRSVVPGATLGIIL